MSDTNTMLVDVYFLMDATGSMNNAINEVKGEITRYVDKFCSCNPQVNLAYGLGTYRDTSDSVPYNFIQQINININELKSNLGKVDASGGGDTLEAQVIPLSLINHKEANWRPGSLRIIAWYGDHGAHSSRTYPSSGPNKKTYTVDTAINNLLDGNMIPIALSVGNNKLNQEGHAMKIVTKTSGRYVDDVQYNKLCVTLFDEISERLGLHKIST